MVKVAVISCNIGAVDEIFPPCKQSIEYDLFYYTESTLPFPLPNLDNRMRGKYLKVQSHKFLPDYDIYIWLDASVEIISKDFIKDCVLELTNSIEVDDDQIESYKYSVVMAKHSQRTNVYEELEYIIDKMKKGDRYLLKRYARQPLYLEYEFYRKNGMPKDYPLYNCSFFARWNDEKTNKIFDDIWDLILRYSNFDQTQFSYCLWKHDAKVNVIETKDYFIRNKHLGYNL